MITDVFILRDGAFEFFLRDYDLISVMRKADNMSDAEFNEFYNYLITTYGENGDKYTDSLLVPGKYAATRIIESRLAIYYSFALEKYSQTQHERLNFVRTANRLGQQAVNQGDTYNIRRNMNIINIYSQEIDFGRIPVVNDFEKYYFSNTLIDFFILILTVLFSSTVFSNDKQCGINILFMSAKNGRRTSTVSKYLSIAIHAFCISFLFHFILLLSLHMKYGLSGWLKPIAAVDIMSHTPLDINVLQFVIITAIFKALAVIAFAFICCMISFFSYSNFFSYVLSFAILSVFYGYYFIVRSPNIPEVFRVFDFIFLTRIIEYLNNYYTANLFGFPVMWYWLHLCFWTLISSFLFGICVFISNDKHKQGGY